MKDEAAAALLLPTPPMRRSHQRAAARRVYVLCLAAICLAALIAALTLPTLWADGKGTPSDAVILWTARLPDGAEIAYGRTFEHSWDPGPFSWVDRLREPGRMRAIYALWWSHEGEGRAYFVVSDETAYVHNASCDYERVRPRLRSDGSGLWLVYIGPDPQDPSAARDELPRVLASLDLTSGEFLGDRGHVRDSSRRIEEQRNAESPAKRFPHWATMSGGTPLTVVDRNAAPCQGQVGAQGTR